MISNWRCRVSEDTSNESDDQEARREQIRKWYDEARAMGVSEEDFIREMTPIVGLAELENALDTE